MTDDLDGPRTRKPLFQYSKPLQPDVYEGDEYFCKYTPRIHRDAHLADQGSWQCQVDFLEASGSYDAERNVAHKSYAVGCINPTVGNFTALCASESIPERLALTTYIVEYAYIHDDVIEYAESKDETQLMKTNEELMEGLSLNVDTKKGTKSHVRRRQLQAKMAVELLDTDSVMGKECLRLWQEMSDVFVKIRDLDFKTLDTYLPWRAVDAGCPWTMSLLCFSMNFQLTEDEKKLTDHITNAAYDAWVLVNDYFSWQKELQNYEANGSKGEIVSAVFLLMKWHSIDWKEARRLTKIEILMREDKYESLKMDFKKRNNMTDRLTDWFELLDLVTAGNFAWSMTTARYHTDVADSYPRLRLAHTQRAPGTVQDGLSNPISTNDTHREQIVHDQTTDSGSDSSHVSSDDDSFDSTTATSHTTQATHELSQDDKYSVPPRASLIFFEEVVLEPYTYIDSLPSKGVRNTAIDGLEAWYQVPEKSLVVIRSVVNMLHSSSLMIDDVEDGSQLRRGSPTSHFVYGISQTINSANYVMIKAIELAQSLSPAASKIVIERLLEGHIGQGMDLNWTYQTEIPTEEEYFTMVDGKTGGLFMLLTDLMQAEATTNRDLDLKSLARLIGRFFQARDDYQNLQDTTYIEQKGYAEDIGEGKLSLPLIHALRAPAHRRQLLSILQQRKLTPHLSSEVRKLAIDCIKASGALEHTHTLVKHFQKDLEVMLTTIERRLGIKNWILRLMQKKLEI